MSSFDFHWFYALPSQIDQRSNRDSNVHVSLHFAQWFKQWFTLYSFFIFLVNLAVGCRESPWQQGHGVLEYDGESIFGSEANLTCEGGYAPISGSFRRVCTNNGRWSGHTPVCAGKKVLGVINYLKFFTCFVKNEAKVPVWTLGTQIHYILPVWSPASIFVGLF